MSAQKQILENITLQSDKQIMKKITTLARGTDHVLVNFFLDMCEEDFVCTDKKGKIFYKFIEIQNVWEICGPCDIFDMICKELPSHINHYYLPFLELALQNIDKDKKSSEVDIEKMELLINKMKGVTYMLELNKTHNSMLNLIISRSYDEKFFDKLNFRNDLLSVSNGVINLKTGKLERRKKEHYFTYYLDISYDDRVDINMWHEYFNVVFAGDLDIVDYMQYILGYCITGEMSLELLMIFWGNGSNSKSVLTNFMKKLLETKKLFSVFSRKAFSTKEESNNDELYDAQSSRLCIYSETGEGEKLNLEMIKNITGEDDISVSKKYCPSITYKPKFKIIINTNNKPDLPLDDYGTFRRLLFVPFQVTFLNKFDSRWDEDKASKGLHVEKDNKKIKELNDNLQGLLKWLVIGAQRYMQMTAFCLLKF